MSDYNYKLAVIGGSGAGKTTLAAGLSQYFSNKDGAVVVGYADSETRDYLEPIVKQLERGEKTGGSNMDPRCLNMSMTINCHKFAIYFNDYTGGVVKDRIENMLGIRPGGNDNPQGALFLLNPVNVAAEKYDRNGDEFFFDKTIDCLKKNGCHCLSLVTVAHDYYKNMSEDKRKKFDGVKSRFLAKLRNSGLDWGEHKVSIDESNKDLDTVKLDNNEGNTTGEPFVWLVNELNENATHNEDLKVKQDDGDTVKESVSRSGQVGIRKSKLVPALIIAAAVVLCAAIVFWPAQNQVEPNPPEPDTNASILGLCESISSCIDQNEDFLEACRQIRIEERKGALPVELKNARDKLLEKLRNELKGKATSRKERRPDSIEELEKFKGLVQDELLPAEEYAGWKKSLDAALDVTGWETVQNGYCNDFLKGRLDNASDVIVRYGALVSEHPNAPKLGECATKVNEVAGKEFAESLRKLCRICGDCPDPDMQLDHDFVKSEQVTFFEIRELAIALNKTRSKHLQNQPWCVFAGKCIEHGKINGKLDEAFLQEYEVTKIDAKLDYEKLPTLFKEVVLNAKLYGMCRTDKDNWQWLKFAEWVCPIALTEQKAEWTTLWEGSEKGIYSPWRFFTLKVEATESNKANWFKKHGSAWKWYSSEVGNIVDASYGSLVLETALDIEERAGSGKRPRVLVRVHFKVAGPNIFDFAKEAGGM